MVKNDIENLFSKGIYQSVKAAIDTSGPESLLEYLLDANDILKSISIENNTLFADSVLAHLISGQLNKPLNYNSLRKGLSDLKKLYRRNGYALIHFNDINFEKDTGKFIVNIDEGKISDINVEGN